jgi:hypothetical protein
MAALMMINENRYASFYYRSNNFDADAAIAAPTPATVSARP